MSKQLTKAEVAQHKDEKAMYIIVDDGVYDIAGRFWECLLDGQRQTSSGNSLEYTRGVNLEVGS